jgi:hypothetical protein
VARVTAKRTERRRAAVSARERVLQTAYRPGEEPVIRTRGLTKRYGKLTAVDRLDLDI